MKIKINKKYLLIIASVLAVAAIIFLIIKFGSPNKSEYFIEVNLPEEARLELEQRREQNLESLKLFPQNYRTFIDLGNIERELGNASKSIEYFTKAWEVIPTNSTPWLNIGNVYIRLGMYQEAEEAFLKAIDVNNTYYLTYFNLAKLYHDFLIEKSDQVRGVYLEGLYNTDNDYQLLQPFTDYLIEVGSYTEALQYLEILVTKLKPSERQQVVDRMNYVQSLLEQAK